MSQSHWRDKAAPIIAKILEATKGRDEKEIRAALRAAYPFNERKYHPYQIWLSEIRIQRGLKPKLGTFGPKAKIRAKMASELQPGLFETAESAARMK